MGGVNAAPNPGLAQDRGSARAQRGGGRRCGAACDHRPRDPRSVSGPWMTRVASREPRQATCPPARRSGLLRLVRREDDDRDRAGEGAGTAAGRTRTQSAWHGCASWLSRWRRTCRATSSIRGATLRLLRSRTRTTTEWRIRKITDEMRDPQEQKNEALRTKLRKEVDAQTLREMTAEIDVAHDQLARENKGLASEAACRADSSLAREDLCA
jgi:hypothetical protein